MKGGGTDSKGVEGCRLEDINPLTQELNPSTRRCLTTFFTGDLAFEPCISLIYAWKNQQIHQLLFQFINYAW
jgi:hypothetical protein